jgi:hypothetical protein
MDSFVTTIALVGTVVVVASLLSGAIERRGIPLVSVFLLLGAALGPWGLAIADVGFHDPALHALAMLGLALLLFSDAVTLDTRQIRSGGSSDPVRWRRRRSARSPPGSCSIFPRRRPPYSALPSRPPTRCCSAPCCAPRRFPTHRDLHCASRRE